jgi:hypothetical protein
VLLAGTVTGEAQATAKRPAVAFTELVITTEPVKALMLPKVSVVEFDAPEVNLTSVGFADIVKSGAGTTTIPEPVRKRPGNGVV